MRSAGLLAGLILTGIHPLYGMARRPPESNMIDIEAEDVSPSEWRGQYCGRSAASASIVSDQGSWNKAWKSIGKSAPAVDFQKYFAAVVFAGAKNTGGYDIKFLRPTGDNAQIQIHYVLKSPGKSAFVIQAFTQPYAVKLYRKTGAAVAVSGD